MIARIVGINLPSKKRIEIGLTYIFGIGHSLSIEILSKANIDKNKLAENLTSEDVSKLKKIIEDNYRTGGELRRDVASNIKRLKDIGCIAEHDIQSIYLHVVRGQKQIVAQFVVI